MAGAFLIKKAWRTKTFSATVTQVIKWTKREYLALHYHHPDGEIDHTDPNFPCADYTYDDNNKHGEVGNGVTAGCATISMPGVSVSADIWTWASGSQVKFAWIVNNIQWYDSNGDLHTTGIKSNDINGPTIVGGDYNASGGSSCTLTVTLSGSADLMGNFSAVTGDAWKIYSGRNGEGANLMPNAGLSIYDILVDPDVTITLGGNSVTYKLYNSYTSDRAMKCNDIAVGCSTPSVLIWEPIRYVGVTRNDSFKPQSTSGFSPTYCDGAYNQVINWVTGTYTRNFSSHSCSVCSHVESDDVTSPNPAEEIPEASFPIANPRCGKWQQRLWYQVGAGNFEAGGGIINGAARHVYGSGMMSYATAQIHDISGTYSVSYSNHVKDMDGTVITGLQLDTKEYHPTNSYYPANITHLTFSNGSSPTYTYGGAWYSTMTKDGSMVEYYDLNSDVDEFGGLSHAGFTLTNLTEEWTGEYDPSDPDDTVLSHYVESTLGEPAHPPWFPWPDQDIDSDGNLVYRTDVGNIGRPVWDAGTEDGSAWYDSEVYSTSIDDICYIDDAITVKVPNEGLIGTPQLVFKTLFDPAKLPSPELAGCTIAQGTTGLEITTSSVDAHADSLNILDNPNFDIRLSGTRFAKLQWNTNVALPGDDIVQASLWLGPNRWDLKMSIAEWKTSTSYTKDQYITSVTTHKIYKCAISHTSGSFSADVTAGKWTLSSIDTTTELDLCRPSATTYTPPEVVDATMKRMVYPSGTTALESTHNPMLTKFTTPPDYVIEGIIAERRWIYHVPSTIRETPLQLRLHFTRLDMSSSYFNRWQVLAGKDTDKGIDPGTGKKRYLEIPGYSDTGYEFTTVEIDRWTDWIDCDIGDGTYGVEIIMYAAEDAGLASYGFKIDKVEVKVGQYASGSIQQSVAPYEHVLDQSWMVGSMAHGMRYPGKSIYPMDYPMGWGVGSPSNVRIDLKASGGKYIFKNLQLYKKTVAEGGFAKVYVADHQSSWNDSRDGGDFAWSFSGVSVNAAADNIKRYTIRKAAVIIDGALVLEIPSGHCEVNPNGIGDDPTPPTFSYMSYRLWDYLDKPRAYPSDYLAEAWGYSYTNAYCRKCLWSGSGDDLVNWPLPSSSPKCPACHAPVGYESQVVQGYVDQITHYNPCNVRMKCTNIYIHGDNGHGDVDWTGENTDLVYDETKTNFVCPWCLEYDYLDYYSPEDGTYKIEPTSISYDCNGVVDITSIGQTDLVDGTWCPFKEQNAYVSFLVGGIYNIPIGSTGVGIPLRILASGDIQHPVGFGGGFATGLYKTYGGRIYGLAYDGDDIASNTSVQIWTPEASSGHSDNVRASTNALGWFESPSLNTKDADGNGANIQGKDTVMQVPVRNRTWSRVVANITPIVNTRTADYDVIRYHGVNEIYTGDRGASDGSLPLIVIGMDDQNTEKYRYNIDTGVSAMHVTAILRESRHSKWTLVRDLIFTDDNSGSVKYYRNVQGSEQWTDVYKGSISAFSNMEWPSAVYSASRKAFYVVAWTKGTGTKELKIVRGSEMSTSPPYVTWESTPTTILSMVDSAQKVQLFHNDLNNKLEMVLYNRTTQAIEVYVSNDDGITWTKTKSYNKTVTSGGWLTACQLHGYGGHGIAQLITGDTNSNVDYIYIKDDGGGQTFPVITDERASNEPPVIFIDDSHIRHIVYYDVTGAVYKTIHSANGSTWSDTWPR